MQEQEKIHINRLVLVGNGFDLAHGLKTSYAHFIENYLNSAYHSLKDFPWYPDAKTHGDSFIDMKRPAWFYDGGQSDRAFSLTEIKLALQLKHTGLGNFKNSFRGDSSLIILAINNFVMQVLDDCGRKNWVDIERIYFSFLRAIFTDKEDYKRGELEKLNHSLALIKTKLVKYLSSLQRQTKRIDKLVKILHQPFKAENALDFQDTKDEFIAKAEPQKILLLNFNYTGTADLYAPAFAKKTIENINIHGQLGSGDKETDLSSIVFGFGNETDELYLKLEDHANREFIRNVKSFAYARNSNYHRVISFIDSEPFEIFVMGHSCGITDHTMLNLIFEHKNCHSIRVFFYENKETGDRNFREVTENIARLFKDKVLFRRRLVTENNCDPMPQWDD